MQNSQFLPLSYLCLNECFLVWTKLFTNRACGEMVDTCHGHTCSSFPFSHLQTNAHLQQLFPSPSPHTPTLYLSLSLSHIHTLRLHLLFMNRRAHHRKGLICFNSCHLMTHCRVLTSILCPHHCLLIPPRTVPLSILANNPPFLPLCIRTLSATHRAN